MLKGVKKVVKGHRNVRADKSARANRELKCAYICHVVVAYGIYK